jgi:hypothetical protein
MAASTRFLAIAAFLLLATTPMIVTAHAAGRAFDERRGSLVASSAPSPSTTSQEVYVVDDPERGVDERTYLGSHCDEKCAYEKVREYAQKHRIFGPW